MSEGAAEGGHRRNSDRARTPSRRRNWPNVCFPEFVSCLATTTALILMRASFPDDGRQCNITSAAAATSSSVIYGGSNWIKWGAVAAAAKSRVKKELQRLRRRKELRSSYCCSRSSQSIPTSQRMHCRIMSGIIIRVQYLCKGKTVIFLKATG